MRGALQRQASISAAMQQQAADVLITTLGINRLGMDPRLVNRAEREEEVLEPPGFRDRGRGCGHARHARSPRPIRREVAGGEGALAYQLEMNTVLTHDLLLAILRAEVRTPEEAAAWLDQHRFIGDSPYNVFRK